MEFFIFIQIITNSGDQDQMSCSAASDLGLHYLPMANKKDARLIWVKRGSILRMHIQYLI